MKPTLLFMRNNFSLFNNLFFNNELPIPIFELMSRKSALGDFTAEKYSTYMRIRLNTAYERSENDFECTLIHEMIHQYIYVKNIRDNGSHGIQFQRIAKRITEQSNGKYKITVLGQLDSSLLSNISSKKYYVIKYHDNKISIISRNFLKSVMIFLQKKGVFFKVYESRCVFFKQFKSCVSRLSYYTLNEEQLKTLNEVIIPKSTDITHIIRF